MAEISKTADHALAALIELGDNGPTPPAELARTLGLSRTVVHRLLTTLMYRGFVVRRPEGYAPAALVARIADQVQPQLRRAAQPVMERLSDAVGESIVIHVPDADQAVVLDQVVSASALVRVEHRIGSRHPLTTGASGRAILAFLDTQAAERIVRGVADPDALRRQLEAARTLGYALSHDELQHGIHGLAVPIRDPEGRTIASLGILAPAMRASSLAQHAAALTDAAERIGRQLRAAGRRGPSGARAART